MSVSQKDSQTETKTSPKPSPKASHNVLVWTKDDEPLWELTGQEMCWPLTVEELGRTFEMYLQMTNYSAREAIQVKNDSVTPSKLQGQELMTGQGRDVKGTKPILKFFDLHFTQILRVKEEDAEQHRKFFDERPYLKLRWYREVLTDFVVEYEDLSPDIDILSLATAPTRTYILKQELYCPEKESVAIVTCKHIIRKESQTDYLKFDRATGGRMNMRSKEFTAITDWHTIASVYDSMISSVEGFLFKGVRCDETNKEKWLPLIPVDQKITTVDEVFSKARSKNV